MGSDADDLAVAPLTVDVKDRDAGASSRLSRRRVINRIAVIQAGMRGAAVLAWPAGRFTCPIRKIGNDAGDTASPGLRLSLG